MQLALMNSSGWGQLWAPIRSHHDRRAGDRESQKLERIIDYLLFTGRIIIGMAHLLYCTCITTPTPISIQRVAKTRMHTVQ